MKHFLLTLALVFATQLTYAQMDEKFYHPDTVWIDFDYPDVEEIIMTADADTIYSFLLKPKAIADLRGAVIYFHGNASNASRWIKNVEPLLKNGFQVVIMDYRGFGKSTGKPTHLNIAKDAQALFDKIIARKEVQTLPVMIYGASIGSQIATKIALDNNSKVDALILDGAMTSFTDVALSTSPAEYHDAIRTYVTSPYSAKENTKNLRDIKVLFIHSQEDFIPFSGAKEMYESTQCEKIFWEFEGKHLAAAVQYPDTFIKYIEKVIE